MKLINPKNSYKIVLTLIIFLTVSNLYAQQYPPSTTLSHVNYNPPAQLPEYLTPFIEENFENMVTRISDQSVFNIGDQKQLRHAYSKRQAWNSDGSYIVLGGYPPKILDGNTYSFLGTVSNFGSLGWSNTNRLLSYSTSASSNYFKIKQLDESTLSCTTIFSRTFDDYNILSHFTNESNISMDDKYVGLYGTKSSTGNSCWVVVYDIESDIIVSETNLNTSFSNVDWVSMSHSGNYVVIAYVNIGSSSDNGIWRYDRNLNNNLQLVNQAHHADLGVDLDGNEVLVYNGSNDIVSTRLDGIGAPIVYLNTAISGGHVSCRNNNRPGWAYVNDHGGISQNGDYVSFKEVFAVKLDNRPNGTTTVQRYTKHYSYVGNQSYYHEPHVIPNRDGTKVMFASTMEDFQTEQQTYPFSWIVETQNSNLGIEDNVLNENDLIVFPNPSSGIVNIKLNNFQDASTITLINLLGKAVYSESISGNNGFTTDTSFNFSSIAKGVYFIRIQGKRKFITKKIILK